VRIRLLTTTKEIPECREGVRIFGAVLIGIVLAYCVMVSPLAATLLLSGGIVIAISFFLRKVDYLIVSWLYLTGFVHLILGRLPAHYYPIVGRGIFWGFLVCIIVAWGIDNILRRSGFVPFDNIPLKATILMFLLWCVLSLSTSQNVFESAKHIGHFVIVLVAAYMFYDFFSRDQDHIIRTLQALLSVTVIICSVIVLSGGHGLITGVSIYKKLSLWFQNPNGLGKLLLTCIPILISAGIYHVSNRSLKFIFVSIMLVGLFLTFSRSSWIAAAVSIAFLQWKSRMRTPIWTGIVAGLFLAALLFPVFAGDTYDYLAGPRYSGRREIWKAAWDIACDYPILGVGLGNSVHLIPLYCPNAFFGELIGAENTHSVYLANAAELGFPSVAIWLAFFVTFVYYSLKIETNLKSEYLRLLCRGATATFLALFVSGIFANGHLLTAFTGSEYHVIVPYLVMAIPFAAKKLEERREAG
jgi:O-antigen ligase